MSKAVLKGRGRGGGRGGPSKGSYLKAGQYLLGKLSRSELSAAIPVLEKYALPGASVAPESLGPRIDFRTFAKHMETLVNMIDSRGTDIGAPECAALGTFICNHGTKEEMAEALLAIMPVATRVFEGYKERLQKMREKSRAAVKDKSDDQETREQTTNA